MNPQYDALAPKGTSLPSLTAQQLQMLKRNEDLAGGPSVQLAFRFSTVLLAAR
jgi:hypothetical protein